MTKLPTILKDNKPEFPTLDLVKNETELKLIIMDNFESFKDIFKKIKKLKNYQLLCIKQYPKVAWYHKSNLYYFSTVENLKEYISILDLENKIIIVRTEDSIYYDIINTLNENII